MTITRSGNSIAIVGILAAVAFAEPRFPGKYCGIVIYDRWDGCTLCDGIYVMYISEAVKADLRDHAGQFVEIDAKKVDQPINPGDGLISEFVYLGAPLPHKEGLSLKGFVIRVAPLFAKGEPPRISISLQNSGNKDLKISAVEFGPTLLAKKTDDKLSFNPSDGPSFALITRHTFMNAGGHGVENGINYSWSVDASLPETVILKPGEERMLAISFDLPQGEYDFLASYRVCIDGGARLTSNLVAFDVDREGKATPVDVKRR